MKASYFLSRRSLTFSLAVFAVSFSIAGFVSAAPLPPAQSGGGTTLKLSIPLPGITNPIVFAPCAAGANCSFDQLAQYIAAIYRYGVGLAVALAVMMIMIGGFIWVTAAGASDRIGKAKEFITAALTGLVLALFSFLILYIVNPRLTQLQSIGVTGITAAPPTTDESGCCVAKGSGIANTVVCSATTRSACVSTSVPGQTVTATFVVTASGCSDMSVPGLESCKGQLSCFAEGRACKPGQSQCCGTAKGYGSCKVVSVSLGECSSVCSSCGDGFSNLCDKAECEGLGPCQFTAGTVSGSCKLRSDAY